MLVIVHVTTEDKEQRHSHERVIGAEDMHLIAKQRVLSLTKDCQPVQEAYGNSCFKRSLQEDCWSCQTTAFGLSKQVHRYNSFGIWEELTWSLNWRRSPTVKDGVYKLGQPINGSTWVRWPVTILSATVTRCKRWETVLAVISKTLAFYMDTLLSDLCILRLAPQRSMRCSGAVTHTVKDSVPIWQANAEREDSVFSVFGFGFGWTA